MRQDHLIDQRWQMISEVKEGKVAIPILLPKLNCTTEIENPFKSISVRVVSSDKVLQEATIPSSDIETMQNKIIEKNSESDPIKEVSFGLNVQIIPFAIEKEETITAIVVADGQELIAGKLRLKHSPDLKLLDAE